MFECELEIDKSVSEVYRAFNDPENMPRWLTGFQRPKDASTMISLMLPLVRGTIRKRQESDLAGSQ